MRITFRTWGVVQKGRYQGQLYWGPIFSEHGVSGWVSVELWDDSGWARRDIRERDLEQR
jgi:hypothetical protein